MTRMTTQTETRRDMLSRMASTLKRFVRGKDGNVTITFALAAIPVIGFVGAAVDYSRANSVRTAMQAALDSTALMLSKDAPNLNATQLNQKATAYFQAMFTHPEASSVQLTSTYSQPSTGQHKLAMSVQGNVTATFSKVLGHSYLPVNTQSESVWGIKRLELALALDNTGSMSSSGKMTQLKIAVNNLIDTLKSASKTPGDIKISIIPFDTTVNLGTAYKTENWLDFNVNTCAHFGVVANGGGNGNGNGNGQNNSCSTVAKQNAWEGCVIDRNQPYDTNDHVPNGNSATGYPANQCGSLVTLMPLSYDWTALKAKVTSMIPSGNTNVTIGLVWAWHSLTSSLPLTEAAAPANDLEKVIILLTDGDNTQNRWTSSSSQIDARTTLACNNVKASGIKLYTVRVINGNATLLSACATNTSMYFNVQQASDLNAVFTAIANSLTNLRLSK